MSTGLNFPRREISFLFTTSSEIKKYHWKFFKKKAATDVITFADKKAIDVVISLDQALAQAKHRGLKLFDEVCLLMCHGLLHAKGFNDLTEQKALQMRQMEFQWLARML